MFSDVVPWESGLLISGQSYVGSKSLIYITVV